MALLYEHHHLGWPEVALNLLNKKFKESAWFRVMCRRESSKVAGNARKYREATWGLFRKEVAICLTRVRLGGEC